MLRRRGMIDPMHDKVAGQRKLPLADHLTAFEASRSHGTKKHAKLTASRAKKIIEGCKFASLADIERCGSIKPLLSMLESYGIRFKQGFREQVPHLEERFVLPAIDYAVPWTVEFLVPVALRSDPTFIQRLNRYVHLTEELDFVDEG